MQVGKLQKLLESIIDNPGSCELYDTNIEAMIQLYEETMAIPQIDQNSELSETLASLYSALKTNAITLHQGECPNFSKHTIHQI